MDTAERNSLLRAFFLFSDADLEANEQGIVSPAQQLALNEHAGGVRQVGFVVIPLSVAVAAALFLIVAARHAPLTVSTIAWALLPVLASTVLGCLPYFYYGHLVRAGRVRTVSGTAKVRRRIPGPRNYVTSYYAKIGGKTFDVWTDDDNFVDGTSYRVHYINKFGVRTVLSAVALDSRFP